MKSAAGWQFNCAYRPEYLAHVLYGWRPHDDGRVTYLKGIEVEIAEREKRPLSVPHPVVMEEHEFQNLFEALWSAGFRPKKPDYNAGSLEATQAHLRDMRHLVSHHFGVVFGEFR